MNYLPKSKNWSEKKQALETKLATTESQHVATLTETCNLRYDLVEAKNKMTDLEHQKNELLMSLAESNDNKNKLLQNIIELSRQNEQLVVEKEYFEIQNGQLGLEVFRLTRGMTPPFRANTPATPSSAASGSSGHFPFPPKRFDYRITTR